MNAFSRIFTSGLLALALTAPALTGASAGNEARNDTRSFGSVTIWRPGTSGYRAPSRHIRDRSDLVRMLAARGYGHVEFAERRGGLWHVQARRNNGSVYVLVVDAEDARILRKKRRGWSQVPVPSMD